MMRPPFRQHCATRQTRTTDFFVVASDGDSSTGKQGLTLFGSAGFQRQRHRIQAVARLASHRGHHASGA